ncbi:hypothetical protein BKA80DRAFT_309583 [Phyllosticta citrichinensis]
MSSHSFPGIPGVSGHEKVLQWGARAQLPLTPTQSPEAARYTKHSVSPLPKLNLTEANQGGLFPRPLTQREIIPASPPTPLSRVETVIKIEDVNKEEGGGDEDDK